MKKRQNLLIFFFCNLLQKLFLFYIYFLFIVSFESIINCSTIEKLIDNEKKEQKLHNFINIRFRIKTLNYS